MWDRFIKKRESCYQAGISIEKIVIKDNHYPNSFNKCIYTDMRLEGI